MAEDPRLNMFKKNSKILNRLSDSIIHLTDE